MVKQKQNKWTITIAACAIWLITWILTQGLFISDKLMGIIPFETNASVLLATFYIALVLVTSLIVLKKYNKKFLTHSKFLYLYILPAILIVILPFHYHLILPLPIYIFMIVASVFWQDYLTFGIFQTYIQSKLTPILSIVVVALMFTFGHYIFIINSFSATYVPGVLALFGVSVLFAWLRKRFGNIYIIDVLHMSFLLLFV